ncbi:MAG: adenine deaminase, partial [Candidatus Latescibacteria bacterium]|nr:adenine deaminase [Candidatus Latescibacterota bacterium]
HAPGLSGKELNAYIAAGIYSDHECTTCQEAAEKLRLGMWIMLREGSAAKNLVALLPLVNNANFRRCLFVTDDRHPKDLLQEGHIDQILRKAVSLGLDPIRAVQMATINTAQRFGLKSLGAVAPGYIADLVIANNLKDFEVKAVFKDGRLIVEDGQLSVEIAPYEDSAVLNTVNTAPLSLQSFKIKVEAGQAKVIELVPDQIVTKKTVTRVKSQGGFVVSDVENDILKLAVIERHQATGNIGLGLVKGFGLNRGALASSVGHDSHNIIVVGTDDRDMLVAVEKIAALGGGYAAVWGGRVLASLPLPIAGLMSDRSVQEVQGALQQLHQAGEELGAKPESPFITLSFLALPVIPELKLTDKGLVDVMQFKKVPLWGE